MPIVKSDANFNKPISPWYFQNIKPRNLNYNLYWNSLQITICKMPKEPPHPRRPLTYYKNPTPPVLKLMIVSDVDLHKSCFYDNCYDMKKMGKVKDIYFNCSYIRVSFEKKNEFILARIILYEFFLQDHFDSRFCRDSKRFCEMWFSFSDQTIYDE